MAGIAKKGKAWQICFYLFRVRKYIYLPKGFPKREVERLRAEVEQLKFYREYQMPLPPDLEAFINNLSPKLRRKLEATGVLGEPIPRTLGELTEAFLRHKEGENISSETLKSSRHTVARLVQYFGEGKEVSSITSADIEGWKEWMRGEGSLSEATVALYMKVGRSVWSWGGDRGYLKENPLKGVKCGSMVTKKKRHVTMEEYRRLLEVCPSQTWRTLLALCRIGGLRSPSETLLVKWGDVDWEQGALLVHSPKTERFGKGTRRIPLFPELREELEASWELAKEGEERVLVGLAQGSLNGQIRKLMEKAGLEPWSRPFHNLRGSRDDDLFSEFPDHVAGEWMGQTVDVARKHYLRATPDQLREGANFRTVDGDEK